MGTNEKMTGQIAVAVATKGEKANSGGSGYEPDWQKFGKFVGIWLVTAAVLSAALIIITVVKGSPDIVRDTIREVDALNMMFSLVLSALLEQIWSKEASKSWLHSLTLGLEGVLTIVGGMLFVAYSILKITDPQNQLILYNFELNVGYIVASTIVVLLGFYSRAIHE